MFQLCLVILVISKNLSVLLHFSTTLMVSSSVLRHTVVLLGGVISSSQGLYLHRTAQHSRRANIYALSGIRTIKAHALGHVAT
jgi:putative AlgH/UPF0301 family transcriptional regulator